jgi:hypothetical protein
MKKLLILVILVVAMAAAGWITLTLTTNRASVNIETQEIKSDTRQMIKEGKELLEESRKSTGDLSREPTDTMEDSTTIPPAPPSDGSAP